MYCIFACSCECAIGARVRLWPATHTKHQRIGHYSFCVRHLYTQFCYCCCSYLLFIRFIYLFIYLLLWNWWLVIASIQMMIVGLLNLSRLFCCPFMFACACRCTLRSDSTRWWLILPTTNRPVANIQKIEVNLCEIECDRIWRIHIFSLYGHYWCALKCLLYFPIWWMKKKILIIERIHFYDVWLCQMQEERIDMRLVWNIESNRIVVCDTCIVRLCIFRRNGSINKSDWNSNCAHSVWAKSEHGPTVCYSMESSEILLSTIAV